MFLWKYLTLLSCPRCNGPLQPGAVQQAPLLACSECEGVWLDERSFAQVRAAPAQHAAALEPEAAPAPAAWEQVRYLPCPCCSALMNRRNFAERSGVIVDVCKEHGTWFDRDELRRVLAYIHQHGKEPARGEVAKVFASHKVVLPSSISGRWSSWGGSDGATAQWLAFEVVFEVMGTILSAVIELIYD